MAQVQNALNDKQNPQRGNKKGVEGLFKGAYPVTESAYCRFKQIQLRQWR